MGGHCYSYSAAGSHKPYLSLSPPNLRHSPPISVSSSPFPFRTISCHATSALSAESPLTGNPTLPHLHYHPILV